MKRIFLALLLVALATLLVPQLRERAQPRIDATQEWLIEGPLSPVVVPHRTIKTESRLGDVARVLIRNRNRGTAPPNPDLFQEFLERAEIESTDAWGSPLVLIQERDSVVILSAGPDLEYDTEDDIVNRIRYGAESSRPPMRRR